MLSPPSLDGTVMISQPWHKGRTGVNINKDSQSTPRLNEWGHSSTLHSSQSVLASRTCMRCETSALQTLVTKTYVRLRHKAVRTRCLAGLTAAEVATLQVRLHCDSKRGQEQMRLVPAPSSGHHPRCVGVRTYHSTTPAIMWSPYPQAQSSINHMQHALSQ